jgi:hypothetical protein
MAMEDVTKVMIVYDPTPDSTKEYLRDHGFEVRERRLTFPIMTHRFLDYFQFLAENTVDQVVITDVKDVVFQRDPFPFLSNNRNLVIGQESILVDDMPWSRVNYKVTFPFEYDSSLSRQISLCAGVIGGDAKYVRDLCMSTFRFAVSSLVVSRAPGQTPDQAALNLTLRSLLTDLFYETTHKDAWVTHLGVCMEEEHKDLLLDTIPKLKNGLVVNANDEPFCIVHQYDRFPEFRKGMTYA